MVQYPITPAYIKNAPVELAALYQDLEAWILADICKTLDVSDDLNITAVQKILTLKRRGYDTKALVKRIAALSGKSEREVNKILTALLQDNVSYYRALYGVVNADITAIDLITKEAEIIAEQTAGTLQNITRSLGFSIRRLDGSIQFYPPAEAYQAVLDDALMQVENGLSYGQAMRHAVTQLADSGINTVEYFKEDGKRKVHVNRADVAVRRAVVTGITQISSRYSIDAARDLNTPYYEVTAHAGARNKDGPDPWSNHEAWQGKVYSIHEGDKYPNIYTVCGWGDVTGLAGANCRHGLHPWIEGISRRTYTDDDLEALKKHVTYNGQDMSQYDAHQTMRRAETRMRALKRRMIAEAASGDRERYERHAMQYKATRQAYYDFAKQTGLRNQIDRANIIEWGPKEERAAMEALEKHDNNKSEAA